MILDGVQVVDHLFVNSILRNLVSSDGFVKNRIVMHVLFGEDGLVQLMVLVHLQVVVNDMLLADQMLLNWHRAVSGLTADNNLAWRVAQCFGIVGGAFRATVRKPQSG